MVPPPDPRDWLIRGILLLMLWHIPCLDADVDAFWTAVDHALARHPQIHRSEADLRAAMETRALTMAKLLPNASLQAGKTLDGETRYQRQGVTSRSHATMAKVLVNQPLVNTVSARGHEQADHIVTTTRFELDAARQEIALQVATATANLLQAREVLDLAEKYKSVTQHHLEVTRLRFRAGESTTTDVEQSVSRAAQGVASLADARNTVEQTTATFVELVGEEPSPTISLPELPRESEGEIEATIQSGFEVRPDLQAVQSRVRENEWGVAIRQAEFLPTVDLTFSATRTWDEELGGLSGQSNTDRVDNRSLMVVLNMPLFNGGETRAKVRQATALKEGAMADQDRLRQLAVRETQQARSDRVHHHAAIRSLESALTASNQALAGMEEEFLVGARTLIDLLDAQFEVFTLQTTLVRHRYQEQLARIRLWKALGHALQPASVSLMSSHTPVKSHDGERVHLPTAGQMPADFPDMTDGPFLVHVATYKNIRQASNLENTLQSRGIPCWQETVTTPDGDHMVRLLVGPFAEYHQVLQAKRILAEQFSLTAGWIPNPLWKKGMTASFWKDEIPLEQKRVGHQYGLARLQ